MSILNFNTYFCRKNRTMISIKPQVLINNEGEKIAIVLPFEEYDRLMNALEELEDIKDYDQFMAHPEPTIPLREAIKMRKKQANH
jgi:PHD/YefM family antitoxin component YafN of YafNO toxin-antitoxin module